jgi:predicted DNA-binding transcriptional regulator AlpA
MGVLVRIIRYAQLNGEKGIPFSREHIRRLEAEGRFPRRIRIAEGGDFYGYIEQEIDDYLVARATARENGRA